MALKKKKKKTLIDDENTMKDDDQNDRLQNVPFKEPWFTTL